jgi:hypothetical protein
VFFGFGVISNGLMSHDSFGHYQKGSTKYSQNTLDYTYRSNISKLLIYIILNINNFVYLETIYS